MEVIVFLKFSVLTIVNSFLYEAFSRFVFLKRL